MAASRLNRWARSTPWLLLALTILVPLIVLWAVLDVGPVRGTCTVAIPFFGSEDLPCVKLRIAAWVLGIIGIFSIVVLLWWLLNELIGLRRIFEVPWFGIGEDVENVGTIESIVRAAVFILIVWFSLTICALAYFSITSKPSASNEEARTSRHIAEAPSPGLKSNPDGAVKLDSGKPEVRTSDIAVPDQWQSLSNALTEANRLLKSQDQKLGALQELERRLAAWEPQENAVESLGQMRLLGGTLDEIQRLLEEQGRKVAPLDDIERLLSKLDTRSVPGIADQVRELSNSVSQLQQSQRDQIGVLERITKILDMRPPTPPPETEPVVERSPQRGAPDCSEYRTSEASVTSHSHARSRAAAEGAAANMPERRPQSDRLLRTLIVFFDKSGREISPGGRADLRRLTDELKLLSGAMVEVSVFGSADAQGTPAINDRYARERAEAVADFIKQQVPFLQPSVDSSGASEPPPSEPYSRIARVEVRVLCR